MNGIIGVIAIRFSRRGLEGHDIKPALSSETLNCSAWTEKSNCDAIGGVQYSCWSVGSGNCPKLKSAVGVVARKGVRDGKVSISNGGAT